MAIETNELIPPAYVYKPISFGSAIQNIGQSQLEAQKYKSEQAKRKDQENKRMLNVDIYATANKTFNDNLSEMRKKIIDQYSQLAAQGHNLSDPSDDAYNLFQSDLNQYKTKAEEFKGAASALKNLELTLRTADPQIANFLVAKIDASKDAVELQSNIDELYNAYSIIAKKESVLPAINKEVNSAGMDAVIKSIKDEKDKGKKITIVKEINETKLPQILSQVKLDPTYIKEKNLFDYKKENGLLQDSEYKDDNGNVYDDYDQYLTAKISDAIALKDASMQQYREKSTFNFSTNVSLTDPSQETKTGVLITTGTPPNTSYINYTGVANFSNGKLTFDTSGTDKTGFWDYKPLRPTISGGKATIDMDDLYWSNWNAESNSLKPTLFSLDSTQSSKNVGSSKLTWTNSTGQNISGSPLLTNAKYDQLGNLWGLTADNAPIMLVPNYNKMQGITPSQFAGNVTSALTQLGLPVSKDNKANEATLLSQFKLP